MTIYFLVFLIALLYFGSTRHTNKRVASIFFVYFIGVALFVGLGDMIGGYDRYIYGEVFDLIADETRGNRNYVSLIPIVTNGKELGYFYWQVLISMFTNNRYIYILVTTIVMYLLFYRAFKNLFEDYPLACIFFLGFLYYFTMTYLRQMLAVGILLQSIPYLINKKPIPFFAIVTLAFTFHNSAAIFAILWFMPEKKYSKNTIIWAMAICFLLAISPLPGILVSQAGEMGGFAKRAQGYVDDMSVFRIDYILESGFFIYVLLKHYELIGESRKNMVFLNIYLIFCGIILLFLRFGQGGRFGWYFMVGLFYILSLIFKKTKMSYFRPFMLTICFLLFFRVTYYWQLQLVPYKTFLSNGIPSGPIVYEVYEYDRSYTVDKFYRKAWDPIWRYE